MYVNALLSVFIGDSLIPAVVSVKTQNDSNHIGSSCDIEVPLPSRLKYNSTDREWITDEVINPFKVTDDVLILAKYEGYEEIEIFKGFIYDFVSGTPLMIKCLDNVFALNQTTINHEWKGAHSLKEIIEFIINKTGISLMSIDKYYTDINGTKLFNPLFEFELEDFWVKDISPAAALEYLKSQIGINISLLGSTLYVNIAANTTQTCKLNTQCNVIKTDLQKPNTVYQKFKVKAWFLTSDDKTKKSITVGHDDGQLREVFFYNVPYDEIKYKQLANEALTKVKMGRYSGTVETYLYPYCDLFYRVTYIDKQYPEKNGTFAVTSINYSFDENGFHKTLKLAHLLDE